MSNTRTVKGVGWDVSALGNGSLLNVRLLYYVFFFLANHCIMGLVLVDVGISGNT